MSRQSYAFVILAVFALSTSCPVAADEYEKCTSSDCSGKKACVTVYQHRNFGGWYQCLTFRSDECTNLNSWWTSSGSRVSGADSHSTCIRLYTKNDCKGNYIDVTSSAPRNGYLNEIGFEDDIYSVSSCSRTQNGACQVKSLFFKGTQQEKVTDAANEILDALDNVVSLAASGFAIAVPGVDLFYSGVKFVVGLFDSAPSLESQINAQVEAAFERNSASQIAAKMHVINRRLTSLLDKDTPTNHRGSDLDLALHTCEEVHKLFGDEHYSFTKNKVVSSPHLVAFSAVYLSVAKLAYQMRPDKKYSIEKDMKELAGLNEKFRRQAILQRKKQLTIYPPIPSSAGTVTYSVFDKNECSTVNSDCLREYEDSSVFKATERCLQIMKEGAQLKVTVFFEPIISSLKRFPK